MKTSGDQTSIQNSFLKFYLIQHNWPNSLMQLVTSTAVVKYEPATGEQRQKTTDICLSHKVRHGVELG